MEAGRGYRGSLHPEKSELLGVLDVQESAGAAADGVASDESGDGRGGAHGAPDGGTPGHEGKSGAGGVPVEAGAGKRRLRQDHSGGMCRFLSGNCR